MTMSRQESIEQDKEVTRHCGHMKVIITIVVFHVYTPTVVIYLGVKFRFGHDLQDTLDRVPQDDFI